MNKKNNKKIWTSKDCREKCINAFSRSTCGHCKRPETPIYEDLFQSNGIKYNEDNFKSKDEVIKNNEKQLKETNDRIKRNKDLKGKIQNNIELANKAITDVSGDSVLVPKSLLESFINISESFIENVLDYNVRHDEFYKKNLEYQVKKDKGNE